jgi:hypothetical protein
LLTGNSQVQAMKKLLPFVMLVPILLAAQDQPPTGGRPAAGRTVTPTRTVVKYTALEENLFQALQDNNAAGLDRILASDFEAWAAEKLSPTPRADWMKMFLGNLQTFRIRNMAVRQFGDVAVVSFLLYRTGEANGKPMSPVLFIVDVWRLSGDKLAVRYASAPANPAPESNKPSGKD